jgi:DNA-binding CsgD family transcriptional regulator
MLCAQSFRAYAPAVAAHLAQRQLARDLVAQLDCAPVSARPLRDIVAQLLRLLDAEQACAFLIRASDGGRTLEFFHGARMPAGIRSAYARWLPTAPKNFAGYDPASPDPRQRNRPLRRRDIEALTGRGPPAVVRSFLPRFALSESDQLRVLVCEGPALLAWVGALRAGSFGRDEVRLLGAIAPALQRRLALERRLVEAQQRAGDIGTALENVPAAAFVLGPGGGILHANEAARTLLDHDRRAVEGQLASALSGADGSVQLARLDPGSELRLAILQRRGDPGPLVAAARARWQLTPRQAQVLHLVGQGLSNRAVAAALSCAESTVELHVTALLGKSQCEGRAQLVARLWSGG